MNLLIVESPSKIKTIQKYLRTLSEKLGLGDFKLAASLGHIRDLDKNQLSVDVDHDYAPQYVVVAEKVRVVNNLKALLKGVDTVWLAADCDREGEAIAWHLREVLGLRRKNYHRITFNEITAPAIEAALRSPRDIDMHMVDAQQGRRVVDRIVGYKLSQLLWKALVGYKNLSAGRVQSVALDFLVAREEAIAASLQSKHMYWNVNGTFMLSEECVFDGCRLCDEDDKEATFDDKTVLMERVMDPLMSSREFSVVAKESAETKTFPDKPFITSSLQQTAFAKLGAGIQRTMKLAQDLYEAGHITYMRTDSFALSDVFVAATNRYIRDTYGPEYCKGNAPAAKKVKGAQEAHEAIRPTHIETMATDIDMSKDHKNLYNLIWKRSVAALMTPALYHEETLHLKHKASRLVFKGKHRTLTFDGYLKVWRFKDDGEETTESICNVHIGDTVLAKQIEAKHHISHPPSRYNESSFVKLLEKDGIGRPSTYGSIVAKLFQRQYIETRNMQGEPIEFEHLKITYRKKGSLKIKPETKPWYSENKRLVPTETGTKVIEFLRTAFPLVVQVPFTAEMEGQLDQIAHGEKTYAAMMHEFYEPFMEQHARVEAGLKQEKKTAPKAAKPIDPVFVVDGVDYTVRTTRYGPAIESGTDKDKEYINLKPYSEWANKTIEQITDADVRLLVSMPWDLGNGKEAHYGRYGFYGKLQGQNRKLFKSVWKDIVDGNRDKVAKAIK
jgi:DNA topoisomerase-1